MKYLLVIAAVFFAGHAFAQNTPTTGTNTAPGCSISGATITCGTQSLAVGSGTVTSVSVTTANGVSGTVATATTTPAISISLGAVTPTSVAVNGATIGSNAVAGIGQYASYGATTTGPGFYSYLTGDTVARVRIGLDANDMPSLAFGPGGATTRDAFLLRIGAGVIQHGTSDAAAPVAQTIRAQSVVAGTTDTAGANFTIGGSIGTGTGAGGDIILQTANTSTTGSTQNTLTNALVIKGGTQAIQVTSSGAASVAASLFNGTLFTGGTATTTFPQIFVQPTGTTAVTSWSTSGTGLGMNLASGFAGNFLDFHVAGAASVFKVTSSGAITGLSAALGGATIGSNTFAVTGLSQFSYPVGAGNNFVTFTDTTNSQNLTIGANASGFSFTNVQNLGFRFGTNSVDRMAILAGGGLNMAAAGNYGWSPTSTVATAPDLILGRAGIASLRFGDVDAAVAVAQTTRVQSVVAGTAAANGANWTLIGSLPTGTGTSGDIILQTGVKTGSGTTQGTATTALTIKGETQALVTAALDASTSAGGALQVAGGASIAKRFWIPAITTSSGLQTAVLCQSSGGEMIADSVACLASSARFKDIRGPLSSDIVDKFMRLPIKVWAYKEEGIFKKGSWTRDRIGPIAEDVEKLDPRLVEYDKDGQVRAYSTEQLLAYTIKVVQEQQIQIDGLRARRH